jgi:hypothetical protein
VSTFPREVEPKVSKNRLFDIQQTPLAAPMRHCPSPTGPQTNESVKKSSSGESDHCPVTRL